MWTDVGMSNVKLFKFGIQATIHVLRENYIFKILNYKTNKRGKEELLEQHETKLLGSYQVLPQAVFLQFVVPRRHQPETINAGV